MRRPLAAAAALRVRLLSSSTSASASAPPRLPSPRYPHFLLSSGRADDDEGPSSSSPPPPPHPSAFFSPHRLLTSATGAAGLLGFRGGWRGLPSAASRPPGTVDTDAPPVRLTISRSYSLRVGTVKKALPHYNDEHNHRAVNTALWCNFLVFSLKFGVWIATSSHVMLAEMVHSIADFANQALLAYGLRSSRRAPDAIHPKIPWTDIRKKPWATFSLQPNKCVEALFSMAITTVVGDGANTLFWKDRWISGQRIEDIAPLIYAMVPKRIANKRTVAEAFIELTWVGDIHGIASIPVVVQFFHLCNAMSEVELQHGVDDTHLWKLSPTGQYSAKSAYDALFQGSETFRPYERIWKSWAPGKCKFFLWLVAHNRCWTADRLVRRNLPRPEVCLLCDQEEETINHLLVSCVFARQFWYYFLRRIGLANLAPQPSDNDFEEWWNRVESSVGCNVKKGLNTLIILGAWQIWKHRNDCVFNGASPNLSAILIVAGEEARLWSLAGAKGLTPVVDAAG